MIINKNWLTLNYFKFKMAVNCGTSVFGLKYKDGVMIASDCGITYGGGLEEKNATR